MSQKWRFDPKWRIKIRFFDVTMRESKIFSIFFLHSSDLSKTQILWKKVFQKIQDDGWNEKKNRLGRHLGFFEILFSTKFASYKDLMNAKRRLKKSCILSELRQKI
jgi:hypothetical protein